MAARQTVGPTPVYSFVKPPDANVSRRHAHVEACPTPIDACWRTFTRSAGVAIILPMVPGYEDDEIRYEAFGYYLGIRNINQNNLFNKIRA